MYPSPGTGPTPPKFRPIGRFLVGPRDPLVMIHKMGRTSIWHPNAYPWVPLSLPWLWQGWVTQPVWACDPSKKKNGFNLDSGDWFWRVTRLGVCSIEKKKNGSDREKSWPSASHPANFLGLTVPNVPPAMLEFKIWTTLKTENSKKNTQKPYFYGVYSILDPKNCIFCHKIPQNPKKIPQIWNLVQNVSTLVYFFRSGTFFLRVCVIFVLFTWYIPEELNHFLADLSTKFRGFGGKFKF